MTLECRYIRRSRFIDRHIVFNIKNDPRLDWIETSVNIREEMRELGLAMFSNRVEIRFWDDQSERAASSEWIGIRDQIREFCDSRLSGHWTWKLNKIHKNRDDVVDLGVDLMFEKEEDLELWLREQGQILRLTY